MKITNLVVYTHPVFEGFPPVGTVFIGTLYPHGIGGRAKFNGTFISCYLGITRVNGDKDGEEFECCWEAEKWSKLVIENYQAVDAELIIKST